MSVTDTTNKCFLSDIFGVLAVEDRGIVVDGDTWDEIPVPNSGYVFVLVALEVCIDNAVGKMETKKLRGISEMILMKEEDLRSVSSHILYSWFLLSTS